MRRAWRVMAALALLLAAASILISVLLFDALQDSRIEVCRETNRRHDKVLLVLDEQIAKLPARRRARAESSKAGTVALIEALTPKRDCERALTP